ncbi:glycosyltransferase family 2 protein [Lacticaseibacillus pantheris]|uniref:Glycosyltransferase-like protein n=2 Tax=Lacticaseibacillus pantheris TaxID=171523 RepID=A0A0R1U3X5_9LACO|nr:glycosyltransferase family 2 protein [Lacticaseibacillus pantheris]KRL87984.1 glycosyltransferase-like protein [Lacticaseibacillus pantheris DSM 15945 = JCM 12539 = NBRC 106106]WKF85523.1 glycosyltransferase family 2 protein [Lacticaseibacillus pantheris]
MEVRYLERVMIVGQLVSVIATVHNLEQYLPRLLTALRHQSYQDLDIILVDDGSHDQSPVILARAATQDQRIRLLPLTPAGGVAAARNAGLELVKGDYVIFVDGDDWMGRDYVRHFVEGIEASDADVVANPYIVQRGGAETVVGEGQLPRLMTQDEFMAAVVAPTGAIRGYLWNKMFRRQIITAHNLQFDEDLDAMEDELFTVRYAIHAERFYFGAHPDYRYGVRSGSLTTSNDTLSLLGQQLTAVRAINRTIADARARERPTWRTRRLLEKG